MAVKKVSSASNKNHYASYKSSFKFSKNRDRKIRRHLKNHPQDTLAKAALERNVTYRRKPPVTKGKNKVVKYVNRCQGRPQSIREQLESILGTKLINKISTKYRKRVRPRNAKKSAR